MKKTFGLLVRRPDLSEEEFHRHWSTVHREHALKISNIRRYVQFHVEGNRNVAGFPATVVDGIPENWWDDMPAVMSLRDNPEYTENAGPDEANFMDLTRKGRVVTTERVRVEGDGFFERPAPAIKAILLLARAEGATGAELEAFLDGPWAAQVAGLPGLVRHVDALAERGPDAPRSDYDAVAELWFATRADLDAATGDLEALAAALDGSPVDRARSASVVGTELRAIWPEA
ncbi:MAG: EthD domain-containing protein [Acidimicrobiia bacterium]